MSDYVKPSLKKEFMDKIQKFIDDYPEHGYRSLAQFIEDAVRRRADELKVFELTPRFEHFNLREDHITVHDRKIGEYVDVFPTPDGRLKCEYCDSFDCDHVKELSEKMQDAVEKGLMVYSDALTLAKMKLGKDLQDKLAEVLETEGLEAFQRELSMIPTGKMKRGIPKGVYQVDRVIWDKRNREEMGFYETLTRAAEAKEKKVPEFIKAFLLNHAEEIKREIA